MITLSKKNSAASASALVLTVLAAATFLMTLDGTVMNVSMAIVAKDLGTTITGIQAAITIYTLVMATLMITGGKLGTIIGRRTAFGLGLCIYGAGTIVTGLAPNLGILMLGWSILEGIGAALILPASVALVAANFPAAKRSATYGMLAAAAAVAVAAGPLIGGAVSTYLSWRYVFFAESVVVVIILLFVRKIKDMPTEKTHLDWVGSALSIAGLGMFVFGMLRSTEWGWVSPKPGTPALFGASLTIWLILAGMFVIYVFIQWEKHRIKKNKEPLVNPGVFKNSQLSGGLTVFLLQYLVQAGVFFAVPLFLSVVLELSPLQTGLRIFPLSIALLIAAVGIPKLFPRTSPRRIVRLGQMCMIVGILFLIGGMSPGANAAVVTIPMVLIGFGLGALASQLGAATVSALPDSESAEVGGLQNTATNLGSSIGTALIGSVLIATLTGATLAGISSNPNVPQNIKTEASVSLAGGAAFVSNDDLSTGLAKAGVAEPVAKQIVEINTQSRVEALRVAFSLAGFFAILSLFFTGRIPNVAIGGNQENKEDKKHKKRKKPTKVSGE